MPPLAAHPPQRSTRLPAGWIIVPMEGLRESLVADQMVIVPFAGSLGVHLIRARKALRAKRPSLF